ncbi:hypothetical protein D0Z07_3597 [Hyphodiscus hymeniophilus]|uniref:Uncharacterized protein n=1 Tax=Hyphodiscus hymeniophilus TaxID=353542 RepID=A0A9P6VKK6_9HELO|nr:hypothetical protein D0Z07_3597 [Hyphodiscus hymeniophilus]
MATAAAGLAPSVNGSSSFGQFRLIKFAPSPPNANDLQARSTRDIDPDQMAQPSRASSGQITDSRPSAAPTTTSLDHNPADSSPSGFNLELVDLASNPPVEGILGPNKDGRVRNPVPSKLKGKTDNKQGNFGVMHMGMSPGTGKKTEAQGRDAAAERDAAARRTSENTASRAKAAQQGKYVPPNKRGLDDGNDRASPFATDKQRKRPLAPDETKIEQARLLTLLRSINPVTVVDQICKAVAYFGGIPGAPPPEDGIFPSSANTGETGALFIGWLSEIFPNLSSPEVPQMQAPPAGGRKKSKAAKAKIEMPPPADDTPNPRNGFGYGQAVSAPAWGLPQSLALVNTVGVSSIPGGHAPVTVGEASNHAEQQTPATPVRQQTEDNAITASGGKRGRGRPKGSTNKTRKSGAQGSGDGAGLNEADGHNNKAGQQVQQSPQVQGITMENAERIQTAYSQMPTNQPLDVAVPQPWQTNTAKIQNGVPAKAIPDELSAEELAVINAFRTPTGPASASSITPNAVSAPLPQQSSTGTGSGVKRKRAPPKPKVPAAAPSNHVGDTQQHVQPAHTTQHTPILPPTKSGSMATAPMGTGSMGTSPLVSGATVIAKNDMQWSSVDTSTPTAPPAKKPRQRKPKVPTSHDPPPRQQAVSIVNQSTPPVMPSTIPDSQATSSQQSISITRPQAEGLEAHYERFASRSTPQPNGPNNNPSVNSVTSITPQQHIRQLQKTSSVPPQSQQASPAQSQAQLQMQRQKSQQSQREEQQKLAQAASARSSSTGGFYTQQQQQQRQPTYGTQQYPSHQTSQLANAYGTSHTSSPQISNNSYRANSTHTLAQASPQFSQPDSNAYRTASPLTIPQPSPSFTQPESNYRTPSTHSITQPSPTYSQAENPYRTASSLSNPTSSYTRTPNSQTQTSQQSHYGQFPDTSYVDLPTLESLGHSAGSTSNTLTTGGYGQQGLGVGLGGTSSSTRSSPHSIYGTSSGLGNAFDTGTNDLLRGVSRGSSHSIYGTSSGLASFDTEQEMRERMMRGNLGMGGRR